MTRRGGATVPAPSRREVGGHGGQPVHDRSTVSARELIRLLLLRLVGRGLAARTDRAAPSDGPRILLIRPDHLGDVLLAAPTGRLLSTALPSVRVDWLVGPWAAEVIRRSSHVGDVLTGEFPGFTRRPKGAPWAPYAALLAEARRLRARDYDAAVILRPDHWWGAMLAATAGIPRRIGYAVSECAPFLTDALPPPGAIHAAEANIALAWHAVEVLGSGVLPPLGDTLPGAHSPTFSITDAERIWAEDSLGMSRPGDGPVVALHPGSGADVKNWLPERWIAVADELRVRHGARLVLTGGAAERVLVERIAAGLVPRPLTLVGQTTLGQLAALFERSALVLGGDSGPLHLAAAVGTPTVRLYGPTSQKVFGPRGDPMLHAAIQASLPCQPCGNIAAPPCGATASPACLRVVGPDTVVEAALGVIDRADRPGRLATPASTPAAMVGADALRYPTTSC